MSTDVSAPLTVPTEEGAGSVLPVAVEAPPDGAPAADGSSGSAPAPVPWTPGVFEAPPDEVAPWGVWIPRIDVEAPLRELGLEADGSLEVPDRFDIAGWYVGGPRPGETGPSVITGHVDSRSGAAVFARLRELRTDDLVHVVYRSGFVTTWRVTLVEQHAKGRFPTDRVYGELTGPGLRLITCGGSFDRASGHYVDNVVVFAEPYATWSYDPSA